MSSDDFVVAVVIVIHVCSCVSCEIYDDHSVLEDESD